MAVRSGLIQAAVKWANGAASAGKTNWSACDQCSEKEIVSPVQDIDEEEGRGENGAGVTINVVRVFHNEDGRCSTWSVLHGRQAAALLFWHLVFWFRVVLVVAVLRRLHRGSGLLRLVRLGGANDGDGAISVGFTELPQKILVERQKDAHFLYATSTVYALIYP